MVEVGMGVENVADGESELVHLVKDSLVRATEKLSPGAKAVPFLTVGATDARFFRRVGATAYGYGLFSNHIDFDAFSTMFHGDNERVDQESLRLSTELWQAVAHDLLVA